MAARCICGMAARLEGHEEFFNQTTKLHLWNINEREDHLRASVLPDGGNNCSLVKKTLPAVPDPTDTGVDAICP